MILIAIIPICHEVECIIIDIFDNLLDGKKKSI